MIAFGVAAIASFAELATRASDLQVVNVDANPDPEPKWTIAQTLLNTPSWYVEKESDGRALILRRCYELGRFKESDLRAGISLFMQWIEDMPYLIQNEERAKVALLSRVLYHVPEFISRDESLRGGYTCSVVVENGDNVRLWIAPLRVEADGTIYIAGTECVFQRQPTFAGVGSEFEYFSRRYPRRHLRVTADGRLVEDR
jgi:hypothetical protein